MQITGSVFVDRVRLLINFEANQLDGGERWEVIVKKGGNRIEAITGNPSPWSLIEKTIAEVLDAAPATPPAKFDMNKRRFDKAPSVKKRRKNKPGDVPDSKFNIAAIEAMLKQEMKNNG